ncbi:MAG: murein L,D-transpeptidase catalytic domain family protein [Legionella sp.]|uniref:murein L,D-transpeptidase catalytic domain family protein n=1 Tax=Legionella sp. TaxID=459 RepID=UPI0039E4B16E
MNTLLTLISTVILTSNITNISNSFAIGSDINTKVQHLATKAPRLNKQVLALALTAYSNASKRGEVKKPVLTVIDYSLPSNKQRMWVFDVNKERLLYNTYVAHGRNSGNNTPTHFSNINSSKESSLGTYITSDTYIGHKGYSLNLVGMDKGFNDNAYNRRVVIHGAWYVEPDFIKKAGRAGLSWGCPAIAQTLAKPVINTIKNGSVVFAYYPDKKFLSHSGYLVA